MVLARPPHEIVRNGVAHRAFSCDSGHGSRISFDAS